MSKNKKIVIVGLGLMGASLGLALRKKFPRVQIIGVSRSQATIHKARSKGAIRSGTTELREALPGASLVVLATPLHQLEKKILEIDRYAGLGTLVTDVGSVKGDLTRWADGRKFENIRFVGAHPMAGSHERGLQAARKDLYQDSVCFVVRGKRISLPALKQVTGFWRSLCRKVAVVDPKTHDRIVAQVSHLPHILASLLVNSVEGKSFAFSGPGFRDTTRIAQGDAELWREIVTENRSSIEKELKAFRLSLDRFLSLLRQKKNGRILRVFDQASRKRRRLI